MPSMSGAWPIAATMRSASILRSVPSTGTGIFFSSKAQSATIIATALLSSFFSILTGITPFKIFTPSCIASLTSCSAAVISSFLNSDVNVTSAPSLAADSDTS